MHTLHRKIRSPASTAATRSPARRNMPASSTHRARLWQRRHLDHRQGPHRAHRRERGASRRRRARRPHPREPAGDGDRRTGPTRTTSRPTRARRSARSTTTRSCSTASRSRWCSPTEWEIARFAASLVRVDYTKRSRMPPTSSRTQPGVRASRGPAKPRGDADEGLRRGRGAPRGGIFRSDRAPQSDGTVCRHGDLGRRRQAHGL